MKQGKKIPQPHYVRKMHYLWRIGALPRDVGVHQIEVFHDNSCGIFQERRCDCNPDIRMKWSQPAAAQN